MHNENLVFKELSDLIHEKIDVVLDDWVNDLKPRINGHLKKKDMQKIFAIVENFVNQKINKLSKNKILDDFYNIMASFLDILIFEMDNFETDSSEIVKKHLIDELLIRLRK